jgi:hypothetical protein
VIRALIDEIAHLVTMRHARKWCAQYGHQELHGAWPPMCGTCHRLI